MIGSDGAGKTTVARRLVEQLDPPVRYLYMGASASSANRLLPTSRLLLALKRRRRARANAAPPSDRPLQLASVARRAFHRVKAAAWLANRLAEEGFRLALIARYRRAGAVVILDRDFYYDYYLADVAHRDRPIGRRIHGWLLRNVYPRPSVVIYLDAPAELLLARKGEGTFELLGERRRLYLELVETAASGHVIDAAQPLELVVEQAAAIIRSHARRAAGGSDAGGS